MTTALTPARTAVTNPKTINLTFTTQLHVPTNICPACSLYKFSDIFGTLVTAFGTLVCCLLSVGLTEVNSFLVSPPLLSLDFVNIKWLNLVCLGTLEPGAFAPLGPRYNPSVCGGGEGGFLTPIRKPEHLTQFRYCLPRDSIRFHRFITQFHKNVPSSPHLRYQLQAQVTCISDCL